MLRASIDDLGVWLNLRAIGREPEETSADMGADMLIAFTDALVARSDDLDEMRHELAAVLGPEAVAPAAAAAGNFQMMNRLVDGVGVAIPARLTEIADAIGVEYPPNHR